MFFLLLDKGISLLANQVGLISQFHTSLQLESLAQNSSLTRTNLEQLV